jgi:hypothetical protein
MITALRRCTATPRACYETRPLAILGIGCDYTRTWHSKQKNYYVVWLSPGVNSGLHTLLHAIFVLLEVWRLWLVLFLSYDPTYGLICYRKALACAMLEKVPDILHWVQTWRIRGRFINLTR